MGLFDKLKEMYEDEMNLYRENKKKTSGSTNAEFDPLDVPIFEESQTKVNNLPKLRRVTPTRPPESVHNNTGSEFDVPNAKDFIKNIIEEKDTVSEKTEEETVNVPIDTESVTVPYVLAETESSEVTNTESEDADESITVELVEDAESDTADEFAETVIQEAAEEEKSVITAESSDEKTVEKTVVIPEKSEPKAEKEPEIQIEEVHDGGLYDGLSSAQKKSVKRNVLALGNAAAIFTVIGLGFIYLNFLPKSTVSNEENRNLTEKPKFSVMSYIKGEYTEQYADYFEDTVPNRSAIKKFISTKLMPLKGISGGDDSIVIYGNTFENQKKNKNKNENSDSAETTAATLVTKQISTISAAVQSSSHNETQTTAVTTTEAATTEDQGPVREEEANGEITNSIVVVNKRGIMLYGGGWGYEYTYADNVNAFKAAVGDSMNVYSMVIPTQVSFYLPVNYSDFTESETDDIKHITDSLVGVKNVDAYSALLKHKDEAIYSRTDHHWQPLGAYYAAEEFAKVAGVPFADMSSYDKVTLEGFVGTLYGFTENADLLNNPENFIYYSPKQSVGVTKYTTYFTDPQVSDLFIDADFLSNSSYYLSFGMDDCITHIHTNTNNGRTLVIFKDSYGNALPSVLTYSFENIYLCDARYFDINSVDFCYNVGATDVLYTMNIFSAVSGNGDGILNNMYK